MLDSRQAAILRERLLDFSTQGHRAAVLLAPLHWVARQLLPLFVVGAVLLLGAARAQKADSSKAQERFSTAVNSVFMHGVDAQLPPHLSDLLGVASPGKECDVKQRTLKAEDTVRGFDVAVDNQDHIVIFVDGPKERVFYMASALGELKKAVIIKEGVGQEQRLGPVTRSGFQKEKQMWLDALVPENPRKKDKQ